MDFSGELMVDRGIYRQMALTATGKVRLWIVRGCGLLMLALAVVSIYGIYVDYTHNRSIVGGVISVLFQVLVGVFLLSLINISAGRGWRKLAAIGGLKWRYEVGEEGIGIHTAHSDANVRWDGMAKVSVLPDFWLIKLATGPKLTIPRVAFTKVDAARMDALLEQHDLVNNP